MAPGVIRAWVFQEATAINDNNDNVSLDEEYILFVATEAGTVVKSRDYSVRLVLEEGENKIYLNKYPQFREGFVLEGQSGKFLTSIDFSNISKLEVKSLEEMFRSTSNINKLDLSKIDTSNVENYWYVFGDCGVEQLDLSGWDLSQFDDTDDLFYGITENLSTIIMHNCNAKTVENIQGAIDCTEEIKGKVTVISDFKEASFSSTNNWSEEKLNEVKSSGNIVVVMKKCDAKNIEELYEKVNEGDVCAIITCNDGNFHYVGNEWTDQEEFENKEINFDELYIIYDDVYELSDIDFGILQSGIYLPESSYSYYNGDDEEMEWPDDNACNVIAEALTGDDVTTYHPSFYPDKIFVCDGKIITKCG